MHGAEQRQDPRARRPHLRRHDAWGREVPGTDAYSFEHIVATDAATGKITEWSQSWDLVEWHHSCARNATP